MATIITTAKVGEPMSEQPHEWTRDDPRWPSIRGFAYCVRCGVAQREDGIPNKPCSGKMPQVTLR